MKSKKGEKNILSERAFKARESTGYSLKDAARLLGFNNYQVLSSIEKGTREIRANELSAMALVYKRSLDYFFEPEISSDPVPLWRKSTEIGVKETQRQFLSFLENYSNMENLLGLKQKWKLIQKDLDKADFFEGSFKLAEQIGTNTWASLNLGSRPAFNLHQVLENDLRIKVLHLGLPEGISGGCVVDDKLGVGILINKNDVPWRRNFDLAHELFHAITWKVFDHKEVGDGTVKTRPEQFADAFASSFLLPERHLRDAIDEIAADDKLRIVDIIELAKDFGVSTEAVLWRLVALRILQRANVIQLLKDPDFREIDRQHRKSLYNGDILTKYPSRYVSLACRCLLEGKISRGTFAGYLEIERAEVDEFLIQQGFLEKNYEKIASA
jgi:Zn-dependent peptidase ImmA (M78 family)